MKASRETDLVRACLELLALRGITAWRNNTTGVFDSRRGVFRTFQGRKGVADILGLLACQGGRLLACECKQPGGRLTPDQRLFLDDVTSSGGLALVIRDVGELDAALRLEGIGGINRATGR